MLKECEDCKHKKLLPITGSTYCVKKEAIIVSMYEACKQKERWKKDESKTL